MARRFDSTCLASRDRRRDCQAATPSKTPSATPGARGSINQWQVSVPLRPRIPRVTHHRKLTDDDGDGAPPAQLGAWWRDSIRRGLGRPDAQDRALDDRVRQLAHRLALAVDPVLHREGDPQEDLPRPLREELDLGPLPRTKARRRGRLT
jgi:hypothetical protein